MGIFSKTAEYLEGTPGQDPGEDQQLAVDGAELRPQDRRRAARRAGRNADQRRSRRRDHREADRRAARGVQRPQDLQIRGHHPVPQGAHEDLLAARGPATAHRPQRADGDPRRRRQRHRQDHQHRQARLYLPSQRQEGHRRGLRHVPGRRGRAVDHLGRAHRRPDRQAPGRQRPRRRRLRRLRSGAGPRRGHPDPRHRRPAAHEEGPDAPTDQDPRRGHQEDPRRAARGAARPRRARPARTRSRRPRSSRRPSTSPASSWPSSTAPPAAASSSRSKRSSTSR